MNLKVLGKSSRKNLRVFNFRGTRYVAGWYEVRRGPRALVRGRDRRWVLASVMEVQAMLSESSHCLETDEFVALNHCTRDGEEVVKKLVRDLFLG